MNTTPSNQPSPENPDIQLLNQQLDALREELKQTKQRLDVLERVIFPFSKKDLTTTSLKVVAIAVFLIIAVFCFGATVALLILFATRDQPYIPIITFILIAFGPLLFINTIIKSASQHKQQQNALLVFSVVLAIIGGGAFLRLLQYGTAAFVFW
jgi:preprotein translocase subunit SecE